MPLNYRGRCTRRMKQAESAIKLAMHYIAQARNSIAVEHPNMVTLFDVVLQDLDHDRHNLILTDKRIFWHSRRIPYSPDDLRKLIKDTPPLAHLAREK